MTVSIGKGTEISSTTPEVYEGPQHGDYLDQLRSLVQKVCSAARKKNVTFHSIGDENYRIVIDEEPIELICDEEKNDTLLKFSWRDFLMDDTDVIISATCVLFYVVREFGNDLDIFDVNAIGMEEFFLAGRFYVEQLNLSLCLSNGNADEVMEFWGPKIEHARILRLGTVVEQEAHETCERIYEKWFQFKGCFGFYADNINVSLANRFRRRMKIAVFSSDTIPVEVVVKWIKGWIMSVPGYNHLALVDFSIPGFRILSGVLWQFGIDPSRIPPNAVIQTRNRRGEISYISAPGKLYFGIKNVYPEEPLYEIDLVFPLDDLVEDVDTDEELEDEEDEEMEDDDEEVEDEEDEEMEDDDEEVEDEEEEEVDTHDEENQQENHQIA
ncbi:hypothetical protein L5515_005222 [Caenorhabditis briggsae]|uniref:Uncharacterized protein n=1 Tax=Caenorhabditis briggsae TaxID=6238 RepID=A0AAE9ER19_CAEBR|nr:hypothetical protein L5515_005222 [Caenorhabditis briggsae]